MNLPKHKFWGAGEPDCPPELKAPNGELHTMRCKVCGDGWRKSNTVCLVAGAAQIEAMVVEAMDEAWDDYVMDTNSFPDDFTLRGRSLGFKAGRWAHVVGQIVARRLAGNAGVSGSEAKGYETPRDGAPVTDPLTTLPRFDIYPAPDEPHTIDCAPSPTGEWVRFDAVRAALAPAATSSCELTVGGKNCGGCAGRGGPAGGRAA